MTPEQKFAMAVRLLRISRGLDQQEVANRLGALGWEIDRAQVNRIETGKRRVRLNEAYMFAQMYGVPVHELSGATA